MVNTRSMLPLKLQLRGWDWFGHYRFPIFLAAIAVTLLYCALFVPSPVPGETGTDLAVLAILPVVASMFIALRQRRVLGLQHYATHGDANSNFKLVVELARAEGWKPGEYQSEKFIRLHVPACWSDLCWGELVTVVFDGNDVAISSICDPTKANPSLTSWGRNAGNLEKVKHVLRII